MAGNGSNFSQTLATDNGTVCKPTAVLSQELIDFMQRCHIVEMIVVSIITLVGVIGNILVILVSVKNKEMKTTNNFMISLLAVSDLTFLIFVCPSMVLEHVKNAYPFGNVYCKLSNYVGYILVYVTIYLLCLMSVDRFCAILFPLKSRPYRTKKNLRIACVCVLVFACAVNVPSPIVHNTIQLYDANECGIKCRMTDTTKVFGNVTVTTFFIGMFLLLAYLLPLFIMTIMYSCICVKLLQLKRQRISDSETSTEKHTKAAVITLTLVGSFFVCWTPIQVFGMLMFMKVEMISDFKEMYAYMLFGTLMSYVSSCINPLLYTFMSPEYRRNLMTLFRQHLHVRTLNSFTGSTARNDLKHTCTLELT